MKNHLESQSRTDLGAIRETNARLEALLDRVRASANPLDPALLGELRVFLETEALPAALEYQRRIDDLVGHDCPDPAA